MEEGSTEDFSYAEEAATFGDRLALARERQGLSQAQLARRLGLRVQSVRNWEADRSEPRANKLQMLAGFLNVSMVWLLTGEGAGAPAADAPGEGTGAADDAEGGATPAAGMRSMVTEIRELRLMQGRIAERMARLEKRLRLMAGKG